MEARLIVSGFGFEDEGVDSVESMDDGEEEGGKGKYTD